MTQETSSVKGTYRFLHALSATEMSEANYGYMLDKTADLYIIYPFPGHADGYLL